MAIRIFVPIVDDKNFPNWDIAEPLAQTQKRNSVERRPSLTRCAQHQILSAALTKCNLHASAGADPCANRIARARRAHDGLSYPSTHVMISAGSMSTPHIHPQAKQ